VEVVPHVVDVEWITLPPTDGDARYRCPAMAALGADLTNDIEFTCPRCAQLVRERVYGPCTSCREQLRATISGIARDIAVEEYTPKMNVTPNAVATKEE
jgi:hypothetical protein